MHFDVRTRTDGPRPVIDPADFFAHDLPAALEREAAGMGPGLALIEPRPLTIEIDGETWTLAANASDQPGISITSGPDPDAAHLRLVTTQLDDLVHDRATPMAWLSSGKLDQPAGRLADLLDWWVILRAAIDGQPMHTPGAVTFEARNASPLELHAALHIDDDPADLRHFLHEAGYLHLTGVFDEADMAEVSADMDRAAPSYSPGDGHSWWARTRDGAEQVVRMQSFDTHSERTAAIIADDRFLGLAEIPGVGHEFGARRADNRIEALFKPLGVVEGISDVPWHKDCSLGRHSYECSSLTVGISVTGADADSGQLRVLAGSHRALTWPAFVQRGSGLPEIDLPTRTGDVTIHLSCTTHMAQPPVHRERRVMYTGFSLPVLDPAAAAAGRAGLRAVRESAPTTVSQRPAG